MTTQDLSENEAIKGYIDGLNAGVLIGWIYNPSEPEQPQHFSVEVDGNIIAHSVAHCYRADLDENGFGNGCHGFFINLKMSYEQLGGKLLRVLDKQKRHIPQLDYRVAVVENAIQLTLLESKDKAFTFKVICKQVLPTTALKLRYGEACIAMKDITLPEGESHLSVDIPLDILDGFSDFFALELDGYPAPLWIAKQSPNKSHLGIYNDFNKVNGTDFLVAARHDAFKAQATRNNDKESLQTALFAYQYLLNPSEHYLTNLKPEKPDISIFVCVNSAFNTSQLVSTLASIILAYNYATFDLILLLDSEQVKDIDLVLNEHDLAYEVLLKNDNSSYQQLLRCVNDYAKGHYSVIINTPIEVKAHWLDELVAPMQSSTNAALITTPKEISLAGEVSISTSFIDINGKPWFTEQALPSEHPSVNYNKKIARSDANVWCVVSSFWSNIQTTENIPSESAVLDLNSLMKKSAQGLCIENAPQAEVIKLTPSSLPTNTVTSTSLPKKKRILLIDHALPVLNQDAGSYAAIQEIKLIQSIGFDVVFVDAGLSDRNANTLYLQSLGVEVVYSPFYSAIEDVIYHYLPDISAVYITRYHVAERLLPIIKRVNAKCPILFNNADLHFLRELRCALKNNDEKMLHQASITKNRELAVMRKVDRILSYNDTEHAVIASHLFESENIYTCPWVLEDKLTGLPFCERVGIAFLGGYNHAPNVEAVIFFVEQVAPLLLDSAPHIDFYIYGSNMPDTFNKFTAANVKVIGFVENLDDLFHQHRIFVAPLLSGAGIKGKVLDALAYNVPTVLSTVAAEGLNVSHNTTTLKADSAVDWCEQIRRLYHDEALWKRISENQSILVQNQYSFSEGLKKMKAIFSSVGL